MGGKRTRAISAVVRPDPPWPPLTKGGKSTGIALLCPAYCSWGCGLSPPYQGGVRGGRTVHWLRTPRAPARESAAPPLGKVGKRIGPTAAGHVASAAHGIGPAHFAPPG